LGEVSTSEAYSENYKMITFQGTTDISPIFLTVTLIIYLIIVELGNEKMRKALFPFVIVLLLVFLIFAATSIYQTYTGLR
jgi:putative effector of murein hydrolase